jgi:two-component system LytT family response regulator
LIANNLICIINRSDYFYLLKYIILQLNYSAVIVDDEPGGTESLELLIKEYCPQINVKAIAHTVQEAIDAIVMHKPAVLFLDIQMPTGSGFEVIEHTTHVSYKVIFTTAHEEYALQAIKANAIDYLLKPIIAEELIKAVDRVTTTSNSQLTELLNMVGQINTRHSGTVKISIPCSEGLLFIESDNIQHMEADSNYTYFFLAGGKKITASKTLGDIEKLLPENFIRVHSAYILNLNKIEKYVKGDGGHVVMQDGSTIPVSRSQKQAFLKKIN